MKKYDLTFILGLLTVIGCFILTMWEPNLKEWPIPVRLALAFLIGMVTLAYLMWRTTSNK